MEDGDDNLEGHYFDCGDARNSDLYTKTSNAIAKYVAATYSSDIRHAVMNLALPTIVRHAALDKTPTDDDKLEHKNDFTQYSTRKHKMAEHMRVLYALLWGQCTPDLQEYAQQSKQSATANWNQKMSFRFTTSEHRGKSMDAAKARYWSFRQFCNMTPQVYAEEFCNILSVIKYVGATIPPEPELLKDDANAPTPVVAVEKLTAAQVAIVTEQAHAMRFFSGCDRARYGWLIEETENAFLHGTDQYPKTIAATVNLLNKYSCQHKS
jgi:hypothetical protein